MSAWPFPSRKGSQSSGRCAEEDDQQHSLEWSHGILGEMRAGREALHMVLVLRASGWKEEDPQGPTSDCCPAKLSPEHLRVCYQPQDKILHTAATVVWSMCVQDARQGAAVSLVQKTLEFLALHHSIVGRSLG